MSRDSIHALGKEFQETWVLDEHCPTVLSVTVEMFYNLPVQ